MTGSGGNPSATPFAVPGGADQTLAAHGLALHVDASEGAYPSGISAMGNACFELYLLTGNDAYRQAAERAVALVGATAATWGASATSSSTCRACRAS